MEFVYALFQDLSHISAFPEYNFEKEGEKPNDLETKCAINHVQSCLIIEDINKQHATNGNIFGHTLWAVFIAIFFGGCGLGFMTLNMSLYVIQGLHGTALQATLMQTCFSCGQLFGSPTLHAISEHIGRKPVYIFAFIMYVATSLAMAYAKEEIFGNFTIGWLYVMRAIQGFCAIVQPMGFTIISDVIPPENRAYAVAFNNLVYMFAVLLVTIANAFILPNMPKVYP